MSLVSRITPKMAARLCVALALLSLGGAYWRTQMRPRTDDATVQANYVQFAPEVSGRVTELRVRDNQYVKAGEILFVVDARAAQYALDAALAQQQLLEEQIIDAQRAIAAESHAARSARVRVQSARVRSTMSADAIDAAAAAVERAQAYQRSMQAQQTLAESNLHRMEPLLAKQYVTPQQLDDARAKAQVATHNSQEAAAALQQALAQQRQSHSMKDAAALEVTGSEAQAAQADAAIGRLGALIAERGDRAAKVAEARLQLEHCTARAPFDGYVTNLNISEGQMATAGQALFTLIDARNWYVVANFRESELSRVQPGSPVDLYVMSAPDRRFEGVVESIGNGVAPEGAEQHNGLPQVDRTINWVHLSARFPVRIRVLHPDATLFRIGETAAAKTR